MHCNPVWKKESDHWAIVKSKIGSFTSHDDPMSNKIFFFHEDTFLLVKKIVYFHGQGQILEPR